METMKNVMKIVKVLVSATTPLVEGVIFLWGPPIIQRVAGIFLVSVGIICLLTLLLVGVVDVADK